MKPRHNSASGKSNGGRLVSAKLEIKNNINNGKKGNINPIPILLCFKPISNIFKLPVYNTIGINNIPIDISYDTIWAVDLKPPKKAYLELLDHPDKIIP
jgi:hypothetical protein